ncbi:hypothetical protein ROJ8625_02385 [Roseivivax jejudonensis]|uniref:Arginine transporter n=1 Tax=Roseivivax jejudonensis TaxID=1529041 RepID=A0A1X6ZEE2_9RHOB|nr:hypothetical protein [Roseivivax jejudonensis]SLN48743.1 hypothetical protein ROJ8625_02385 [Roseivivax jejudonensis]
MKAIPVMMAAALVVLSACGARDSVTRSASYATPSFASGPMKTACLRSDRAQRNSRLCGCIQSVADQSLSNAEQRLAVSFFSDPHRAQEIRQSDRPNHERMWRNYKAFVGRAERSCRGL